MTFPSITPIECALVAHASRKIGMGEMLESRKSPRLPNNLLRHADEQTVASVAAVFDALERANLPTDHFADWAVVAAPRFIGRDTVPYTVARFSSEGAWGVSPHLIPHRSLHSVPGTISQALKLHGTNFAVGSGPGCEAEALLAGIALLFEARLPGVWIVVSRLDPEGPIDHTTGTPSANSVAHAVALALTPVSASTRLVLEFTPGAQTTGEPLTPDRLADFLDRPSPLLVQGLGRLSLKPAGHALAGPHFPFFAPVRALAEDRT